MFVITMPQCALPVSIRYYYPVYWLNANLWYINNIWKSIGLICTYFQKQT